MSIKYLKCDNADIARARNKIPQGDFTSESWDTKQLTAPKKLIVLLSTPRSGSTYFCQRLLEKKVCIAHEYCQPFEYILIAGERWGCQDEHGINLASFTKNLVNKRTTDNGILGINLHGHHPPYFESILDLLPFPDITYIHIERREKLNQAISYEIASQSNNWSSEFKNDIKLKYNRENIKRKLDKLDSINRLITLFLERNNIHAQHVFFEDILRAGKELSTLISPYDSFSSEYPSLKLEKQSNAVNKNWANRYTQKTLFERLGTFMKSYLK